MAKLGRKMPQVIASDHGVSPPTSSDSSVGHVYATEKGLHNDYLDDNDDLHVPVLDRKAELKLLAQIDWRVMPILCVMFTLAFLDKVNIANGQTFGLSKELKLKGTQYNNCVCSHSGPSRRALLTSETHSLWFNTSHTWCLRFRLI